MNPAPKVSTHPSGPLLPPGRAGSGWLAVPRHPRTTSASFVVGLRYFAAGELVPASDPIAAKVAREHPELLHLIYPERDPRKDHEAED